MLKKLFESILSESATAVVYRGTDNPKFEKPDHRTFTSEDEETAADYGNFLYRLEIDTSRCFDSLDGKMVEWIFENGFKLHDGYNGVDIETISDLPSAYDADSWEFIESTPGLVDFIFKKGWTAIHITEGGISNYYISPETIIAAQLI